MDGNRFDDITRKLGEDASRRSFLKRATATLAALAGLGGASVADAARRPAPTPKPVSCPGSQTWNGSACVCPGGMDNCGSDCCPAGAPCCDGACCYGTCYGEELCCPTGQLVCNGFCLAPGQCCSSADCSPGFACIGNACVCQATTSCTTAGLNCGTFTDDCGAINDCGACTPPQTCGGSGTQGVCGCISTMSCEGRCGPVPTECGDLLECGNPCGACQQCQDNACTTAPNGTSCNADACWQGAICVGGTCSGGFAVQCLDDIADRCNRNECDPSLGCVKIPTNEGGSCTDDPCSPGICRSGVCQDKDKECGVCETCAAGECIPGGDGDSCGDGLHCMHGNCCNMPEIGGSVPTSPDILGSCYATDSICCDASEGACCPGFDGASCCELCIEVEINGVTRTQCCPETQMCDGTCCWETHTCVSGRCVFNDQVCAGGVVCPNDKCCGATGSRTGTCCESDEYCISGTCTPMVEVSCTSNEACDNVYPGGGNCVGLERSLSTGQVTQPGVCYPANFSYFVTFGSGGPVYDFCLPNQRPTSNGCCSYPNYDCPGCSCSRAIIRRWGS